MAEAKRLYTPEGTPPSHQTLEAANHSNNMLQVLMVCFQSVTVVSKIAFSVEL